METVANSGLGYLRDQCLSVTQQQLLEFSASREFILQHFGVHSDSTARALDHRPVGHCSAAHEERDPYHPIIPRQPHLRTGPILHCVKKRNDGVGREIDVVQVAAEFIHDFTELKRHFLQLWKQPLIFFPWQRSKQAVFTQDTWWRT